MSKKLKCTKLGCTENATHQLLGKHPICRWCAEEKNAKARAASAKRRALGLYSPSILKRRAKVSWGKVNWGQLGMVEVKGGTGFAPPTKPKVDRYREALAATTSQLSLYAKELDAASLDLIRENKKLLNP